MSQPPEPMNEEVLKALVRMALEGDMNAAHSVENEIDLRGLRAEYARALIASINLNDKMRVERDALEADPPFFGFDCVWYPAHATAEQRARAALNVLPSGISDMFRGER